jgi:hypothetical protein
MVAVRGRFWGRVGVGESAQVAGVRWVFKGAAVHRPKTRALEVALVGASAVLSLKVRWLKLRRRTLLGGYDRNGELEE